MPSSPWYRRLNRLQWTILFIAWLGWVFDIMDTALFNFAKVPMMTEMLGSVRYKVEGPRIEGLIQTWFLVGWAIGGLVFGLLADRWGRTRTLMVTILMYCTLTGLTAFCLDRSWHWRRVGGWGRFGSGVYSRRSSRGSRCFASKRRCIWSGVCLPGQPFSGKQLLESPFLGGCATCWNLRLH